MTKRDIKKELGDLYSPPKGNIVEATVPPMNFLMIDGQGDPTGSDDYSAAVEALFTISYAIRFAAKRGDLNIDYSVLPLEGLWWADDLSAFTSGDRGRWKWTMMIVQPDFITAEFAAETAKRVGRKKALASGDLLRFERFDEGLCAQMMHVGPFSAEGPVVEALHEHIRASGRALSGKHHEIYLTDIRRADSARWKTVLRQPMR